MRAMCGSLLEGRCSGGGDAKVLVMRTFNFVLFYLIVCSGVFVGRADSCSYRRGGDEVILLPCLISILYYSFPFLFFSVSSFFDFLLSRTHRRAVRVDYNPYFAQKQKKNVQRSTFMGFPNGYHDDDLMVTTTIHDLIIQVFSSFFNVVISSTNRSPLIYLLQVFFSLSITFFFLKLKLHPEIFKPFHFTPDISDIYNQIGLFKMCHILIQRLSLCRPTDNESDDEFSMVNARHLTAYFL